MAESTRKQGSEYKESKYKNLLSNTAIVGIGTLGSKLLMYLLVRFYTEVLSSSQYSVASNITETAALLIPFISFGIGEAVFRFGLDKDYKRSEVFSSALAVVFIGLVLLVPTGFIFNGTSYFRGYGLSLSIYVFSSILHTVCSQFIRSQNKFFLFALQGILNTLFTVGFNVLFLVPLEMGIKGYVLSVAAADALSSLFIVFAAKLWNFVSVKDISKRAIKNMLIFSIPLIPTMASWWIVNVSDRYMITYFIGDSANGIYAASYKIPTLLTVFVGIFNNAWKYSSVKEEGSSSEGQFVSNVYRAFTSVMLVFSVFIIAFSKLISRIMFASDFYSAWRYIPILTLGMLFSSFSSFCGTLFIAKKKSVASLVTTLIPAIVNVTLNLLLIPYFAKNSYFASASAIGAAFATFVSYLLMFILKARASRKYLDYNLEPLHLSINVFILSFLAIIVTANISFAPVVSAFAVILVIALNFKTLLKSVKIFLKK